MAQGAEDFAERYFTALHQGRVDEAYKSFTPEFQSYAGPVWRDFMRRMQERSGPVTVHRLTARMIVPQPPSLPGPCMGLRYAVQRGQRADVETVFICPVHQDPADSVLAIVGDELATPGFGEPLRFGKVAVEREIKLGP